MAQPHAIADLDRIETLLWTILATFESLAAEQYARSIPSLATPAKERVVAELTARIHDDAALAETTLAQPVAILMSSARSTSPAHVLIVQGLLLELVGAAIYRTFAENAMTSEPTRALCDVGLNAATLATSLVPALLRENIGTGDVLLQAFMDEADAMLRSLDALGEGIDAYFSERFNIGFADLMGDVAAELIALAIDLGVDRRKLVAYLTGALMGV